MADTIVFPEDLSVYAKANLKHGALLGGKALPEYDAWKSMRARCLNPSNKRFSDYGGRGITVCQRWSEFPNFLQDMGRKPSAKHSIDRIDNNRGYEPGNCRWALPHQQMTNRSMTRFVEFKGESVPLASLAKKYGIPANTLRFRVMAGWDVERALTQPVRPKSR
tara:strand:+ start:9724 stop:10215 length:492 start_codon:yes stop_codon:yes gene_type:complete